MSLLLPGEVAVLRTCKAGGESRDGFVWPLTVGAEAEASDWSPVAKCGSDLHGLLRGVTRCVVRWISGSPLRVSAVDTDRLWLAWRNAWRKLKDAPLTNEQRAEAAEAGSRA